MLPAPSQEELSRCFLITTMWVEGTATWFLLCFEGSASSGTASRCHALL